MTTVDQSILERRGLAATFVAAALAFGCGGGGEEGASQPDLGFESQPTVPTNPTYRQKVLGVMAGTFLIDCASAGQKSMQIGQDGVIRATGLRDVDLNNLDSVYEVYASLIAYSSANQNAAGITLTATTPTQSVRVQFDLGVGTAILFRQYDFTDAVTRTTVTCRRIVTNLPGYDRATWDPSAFVNEAAHADRTWACGALTFKVGDRKQYEWLVVPVNHSSPRADPDQNFSYRTSDGTNGLFVLVSGANRSMTWNGVACSSS